MNHFKRIQELPADLRAYTQTVLTNKSLEREKEEQKESALAALKSVLPQGAKSLFVVTQKNVILIDAKPSRGSTPLWPPERTPARSRWTTRTAYVSKCSRRPNSFR